MQHKLPSSLTAGAVTLALAGLLLLEANVAGADPGEGFGRIFLDVREAAQQRLDEAEALAAVEVTGFGRREHAGIGPIKQQLREVLGDPTATDEQVHRAAVRLKIAIDRYKRAESLEATVREAKEAARGIADDAPVTGFGRRYQQGLVPLAEAAAEPLADGEATLEQIEQAAADLHEALEDYRAVEDLVAAARDAIAGAALVERHAGEDLSGLAPDAVAKLPELIEALEAVLGDPEATLEQFRQRSNALNDALERIGSDLEQRFTDAVNRPSPAFPDGLDEADFEQTNTFTLPVRNWRFRRDVARLGQEEGWFQPDYDDSGWRPIEIESFWHELIGDRYIGVAWYRATIDVPELGDHDALGLRFEGVDENGWVWINGEYAGQHNIGPAGWNRPFQLDVTDLVTPGEPHQITVRVRNSTGAGGIWQPAHVVAYRHRDSQ